MTETEPDEPAPNAARFIDAAWVLLEQTGFEGFKIAGVVRATNSSVKAFYRCFDSKDALILELLLDEMRRAARRIAQRLDETEDPRLRCRRGWSRC